MNNNYKLDIGRNVDNRYVLNLNEETGIIIAGYTNVGKTNLIEYMKSQLLTEDCEIFSYNKRIRNYDKQLIKHFETNLIIEDKESKIFTQLKNHKKEIERRLKVLKKANLSYVEYVETNITDKSKWKDRIVIIDDFSVNLINLKLLNNERYEEYISILEEIITTGNECGYKLILCGLRCKNSDIPDRLSNLVSCKISFSNPYSDLEEWNLIEEGMKYPKKVGELLVVSGTYGSEPVFVKTYSIDSYIIDKRFIFEKISI